MKNRYRVFRRGWGTFYCEDLVTKKQTTLGTRDKDEAYCLVAAKNETEEAPRSACIWRACIGKRVIPLPPNGRGNTSWTKFQNSKLAKHNTAG